MGPFVDHARMSTVSLVGSTHNDLVEGCGISEAKHRMALGILRAALRVAQAAGRMDTSETVPAEVIAACRKTVLLLDLVLERLMRDPSPGPAILDDFHRITTIRDTYESRARVLSLICSACGPEPPDYVYSTPPPTPPPSYLEALRDERGAVAV